MHRRLTSLLLALGPLVARADQHTTTLADIADSGLRQELAQVGGYPELLRLPVAAAPVELPLRHGDQQAISFASDDIRVTLLSYPFQRPQDTRMRQGARTLYGAPVLGWASGEDHTRLARLEVVWDGLVVEVPVAEVIDVFDARFCEAVRTGTVRFTTVVRSADGHRLHVQVLAGAGPEARLITWVFEEGRYVMRVVDRFSVAG